MRRLFTLLLWAMCALPAMIYAQRGADRATSSATYTNPLRLEDGSLLKVSDPFVFRAEGRYYLIGTTRQNNGFDCYSSTDLAHWSFCSEAYTKPEGHYGAGAFWAPEVFAYRGKYYLTYSAHRSSDRCLLSSLAVSDRPEGPYQDLHAPWFDFGYSAIDCHIFQDDDPEGSLYLFFSKNVSRPGFSSGENWVVALPSDLSTPTAEVHLVGEAVQEWERINYDVNHGNEGVYAFKHKGTYYHTYSANNTCYNHYGVGYATAKHPLGPWTKAEENPILSTDLEHGASSPGHNSLVRSPDGRELFIIYHCHSDPYGERPTFDRSVWIDRVKLKKGRIEILGPTNTPQPLPSGVE